MGQLIQIKRIVFFIVLHACLLGCASTEDLYAQYEHECNVSLITNASGVAVVDSAGRSMQWEPVVYFDFDTNVFNQIGYTQMDKNIEVLKAYPELLISVRSFTDSKGSSDYNKKLSKRRSKAVKNYLIEQGIKAERIVATGHGEEVALVDNDSEVNRSINRRVEFMLLDSTGRPAPINIYKGN